MKRFGAIIILFCSILPVRAQETLAEWRDYLQRDSGNLRLWIASETRQVLGGEKNRITFPSNCPAFYGTAGLFITLRSGKTTRGCYGAFYHGSPDLQLVLKDYLRGALRRDQRHEPLRLFDLDNIEIIMTVAGFSEPAQGIPFIDTRRTGIMIEFEDEISPPLIFVPGELANNGKLEQHTRGKPCQFSTFNAVTFTVRP